MSTFQTTWIKLKGQSTNHQTRPKETLWVNAINKWRRNCLKHLVKLKLRKRHLWRNWYTFRNLNSSPTPQKWAIIKWNHPPNNDHYKDMTPLRMNTRLSFNRSHKNAVVNGGSKIPNLEFGKSNRTYLSNLLSSHCPKLIKSSERHIKPQLWSCKSKSHTLILSRTSHLTDCRPRPHILERLMQSDGLIKVPARVMWKKTRFRF